MSSGLRKILVKKKYGGVSTKDALESGGMGHHSGLRRVGGIEHELVDLMARAFGMDPSGGGGNHFPPPIKDH